jgi:hypothetical protein
MGQPVNKEYEGCQKWTGWFKENSQLQKTEMTLNISNFQISGSGADQFGIFGVVGVVKCYEGFECEK